LELGIIPQVFLPSRRIKVIFIEASGLILKKGD
jgi:hypothetical protein